MGRIGSKCRGMSIALTTMVLIAGVSVTVPSGVSAAATVVDLGGIGLGERIDVDGAYLGSDAEELAYYFEVEDKRGRLRVSLDLSNRDDCLDFVLIAPDGSTPSNAVDFPYVCPPDGTGQVFNVEQSVQKAKPGQWTLLVRPFDIQNLAFRARIALDADKRAAPRLLKPDLVPWLPWEFGFAAPAGPNPGTANDRDNVPGDPTVSCHPEEEAEDTHCLRFSAGVYNVGDGPMYITFRDDVAYQHVYRRDHTPLNYFDNERSGKFLESEAGTGEWHPFHDHRHLSEFVDYQLFAVTNCDELSPLGGGQKHGYCSFSQQIRDWHSTVQDPQYASYPDGEFCHDAMTLERGWGDIYRWQRPGQYLPYDQAMDSDGSMTAGSYLIRFTVDPADHIDETAEGNNVGYALIKVSDGGGPGEDAVIVCEQGLGSDPWDPAKQVQPDRFLWAKLVIDPGYIAPVC